MRIRPYAKNLIELRKKYIFYVSFKLFSQKKLTYRYIQKKVYIKKKKNNCF